MRSAILDLRRGWLIAGVVLGVAAGCSGGAGGGGSGSAGTTGAAGTTGGAGMSGAAGTATGAAGASGAAGAGGTAGVTGSAGSAVGAGGTTGAGGQSGSGGSAGAVGAAGQGGSVAGRGGASGGAAGRGGSGGSAGNGSGGSAGSGGGGAGAGGAAGAAGSTAVVGVACTGTPPWITTGTPVTNLTVNAGSKGAAWSRFYESAVATDHANTILTTTYGRNIQAALKKGHDQAGFRYARFHGILNDDVGVYSEPGGAPTYTWTKLDQIYDAVVAAGMRPMVEVSFTPKAMASDTTQIQTSLWYNNMSPNISQPKDWTKWQALMKALVQHLESRYGAAEVRNNWYFEIWNEASWMYGPGAAGYNVLYQNTVAGLVQGDPQVKVGGPADTGGNSPYAIPSLISFAKTNNVKLDFVSFHRYGDDGGGAISDANGVASFSNQMVDLVKTNNFTGELWSTEFGPTYMPDVARDNESSASFVAKLVHLVGADATHAAPTGFGYWALSDLYEEIDTGAARAYREGNYGMLLKGDPAITESFDVPKPAFNAFRVLHLLGANQLPVTGGSTADSAVNALATIAADGQSVQILVYNHVAGAAANSSSSSLVNLTVNNIPFATSGTLHVRHYMIDRAHSNSYQTWVSQGKPATPTQAQWASLRDTGELCSYTENGTVSSGSWTIRWPQNVYGVSLIVLTP